MTHVITPYLFIIYIYNIKSDNVIGYTKTLKPLFWLVAFCENCFPCSITNQSEHVLIGSRFSTTDQITRLWVQVRVVSDILSDFAH